jgi:hypothetical protein
MPPVDEEDAVPSELAGKSAAEIAAYYVDREATIMENARRMVTEAREGTPPPVPPVPPTSPKAGETVSRDEFNQMAGAAQQGLIQMAQMTASTGKEYWTRVLPEVKKIVEAMPPLMQINSEVWNEAYFNVVGRMSTTLMQEVRNRALGLEPPSPPPTAPEKARVFTEDETRVISGLGVTPQMYADAEKKLETNHQPFTTDTRRK